jgi:hypothetical protein
MRAGVKVITPVEARRRFADLRVFIENAECGYCGTNARECMKFEEKTDCRCCDSCSHWQRDRGYKKSQAE